MGKRKFCVTATIEVELELDDQVIDVVDDEWRAVLYNLNTPEEIAEHIALNLLEGASLSQLDGWADQESSNARIISKDYLDVDTVEV